MRAPPRRDSARFWLGLAALAAFFVAMASWTPIQLDDWYQVDWLHRHGLSAGSVVEFARHNYHDYNPRLGETILLLLDGPRLLHCIATPAAQLLLLCAVFALARGAWPKARAQDLGMLVVLQALIWLAIPIAGPIYFYRPYTANYLFASCLQLMLLVPYRLELARDAVSPRRWLVPVMVVWGVAAGMANEHTGPTAIVAAIAFAAWAWRHGRLRGWMIAGVGGLAAGYLALLLAPGQTTRYSGVGAGNHPFRTLLKRGLSGNLAFVADYATEIAPAVALVVVALAVALRRRANGDPPLDRAAAIRVGLPIAAALAIVCTAFASPLVEDRLFFAPCLVTVIALALVLDLAWSDARVRRASVAAAAAIVAVHAVAFAVIYRGLASDTDDRLAAIEHAPPGTRVEIPPAREWQRDHWRFGEDFQNAYMREMVAHHLYGAGDVELAPRPAWGQPNPPEHAHLALVYDPPLASPPSLGTSPLADHVPVQAPWAIRELREAWGSLANVPGHALREVAVDIDARDAGLPGERPVHLATWRAGQFAMLDAHPRSDERGYPYLWLDARRLPISPTVAFTRACGVTTPAPLTHVGNEVRAPVQYRCAGNHTLYVCDARECWLAERFW